MNAWFRISAVRIAVYRGNNRFPLEFSCDFRDYLFSHKTMAFKKSRASREDTPGADPRVWDCGIGKSMLPYFNIAACDVMNQCSLTCLLIKSLDFVGHQRNLGAPLNREST